MNITYFHIEDNALQQINEDILPEDWEKKVDWVHIYCKSRKEVADYFEGHNVLKGGRDYLENPENHTLSQNLGESTILNLVISNKENIYIADYITVIIDRNLVITILPESMQLFDKSKLGAYSKMKFPGILNYLFFFLTSDILLESNNNIGKARNRIKQNENLLVNSSSQITSKELIHFERDISQLADIIEDQYMGFGILSSLSTSKSSLESIEYRKGLVKGFEPIHNSMNRLEEKAESLRLQYLLVQQEKSTRKINFLTIVQAIFVPLTFIAGVYGMNFVNMPELGWKYSYLTIWLIFIVMSASLLSYFYKHGWFD